MIFIDNKKNLLFDFLHRNTSNNIFIVLDTSAWLRLFRAAPNRVPGFLFNYFNCGYPLRITGHIKDEFDKNIEYVEKDAVESKDATAKYLNRGKRLQFYAMDNESSETKGEDYKKLLAIYGGKATNDMIEKTIQAMMAKPIIRLTEEETKKAEAEAAQLSKQGHPFPGSSDLSKTDNLYGDYLIFAELKKLAIEEKAEIIFATFDLKEREYWPSFEEEFKKETSHELCYIDIPAFDQFVDRYGDTANEVAGRDQRNRIISTHLREVEIEYANEAGKAVEDYFALRRCYLSVSDWRKAPIDIKLLGHKEAEFHVDFGTSGYGCTASYDCTFNVEAEIEITYQIIPEGRQESLAVQKELKKVKGVALAVITRHYDRPKDILKLQKEHWLDISNIDFVF